MIDSCNEWSNLKKVLIGQATDANWPVSDTIFGQELNKHNLSLRGPVSQRVIEEINQDLDSLATQLISHGIEVVRPDPLNFQTHDGMHCVTPRDRLLIYGDTIIDTVTLFESRNMEAQCYYDVLKSASKWSIMPRSQGMILDASNVIRLNHSLLYLDSVSGNNLAYQWLCNQFPDTVIERCNFYQGMHLNSTVMPLREGLVMLNASRVRFDSVPRVFDGWHKIWINTVTESGPYLSPWASKWSALSVLVIDPHTVVVDKTQTELIKMLKSYRFEVIPMQLRHSGLFGCGFHSVALDLVRQNS